MLSRKNRVLERHLERLRSWTLTQTGAKMSFTKTFAGSQSTEVRCPGAAEC